MQEQLKILSERPVLILDVLKDRYLYILSWCFVGIIVGVVVGSMFPRVMETKVSITVEQGCFFDTLCKIDLARGTSFDVSFRKGVLSNVEAYLFSRDFFYSENLRLQEGKSDYLKVERVRNVVGQDKHLYLKFSHRESAENKAVIDDHLQLVVERATRDSLSQLRSELGRLDVQMKSEIDLEIASQQRYFDEKILLLENGLSIAAELDSIDLENVCSSAAQAPEFVRSLRALYCVGENVLVAELRSLSQLGLRPSEHSKQLNDLRRLLNQFLQNEFIFGDMRAVIVSKSGSSTVPLPLYGAIFGFLLSFIIALSYFFSRRIFSVARE